MFVLDSNITHISYFYIEDSRFSVLYDAAVILQGLGLMVAGI